MDFTNTAAHTAGMELHHFLSSKLHGKKVQEEMPAFHTIHTAHCRRQCHPVTRAYCVGLCTILVLKGTVNSHWQLVAL